MSISDTAANDENQLVEVSVCCITPIMIDWLTAFMEGIQVEFDGSHVRRTQEPSGFGEIYSPSTAPHVGHPLLKRESIQTRHVDSPGHHPRGLWMAQDSRNLSNGQLEEWIEYSPQYPELALGYLTGPTILVAGLRFMIAKHLVRKSQSPMVRVPAYLINGGTRALLGGVSKCNGLEGGEAASADRLSSTQISCTTGGDMTTTDNPLLQQQEAENVVRFGAPRGVLEEDHPKVFYAFPKALYASPFNRGPLWFGAIRARLHGLRIKLLSKCGYGVVVVGRCGTGKTFMLERALPGKVVQPDRDLLNPMPREPLDTNKLPSGICVVEEAAQYDWARTRASFPTLRERKVIFTVQDIGQILTLGLHDLYRNRLVIVFIGTKDELHHQCRATPYFFRQSALGLKFGHRG